MADQATFADDAMQYLNQLFSVAQRLTGNRTEAEDLVQETYLNGYRAYGSFEEGTNLRAWLFKILQNNYKNALRTKSRRPVKYEPHDDEEIEEHYFMNRTTPEDVALDRMTDPMVKKAVDELPEAFREAVLLADVEGFTYAEIAEITEVPIGTVMSRIHRGRKSLQKTLYEYAVEQGLIATPANLGGGTL